MSRSLDPITLEIVWNGLLSVTDECFITLMRSAYSTNIKERHDHSIAIADAKGRLIAQSQQSLPVHISSMTGLIAALLEKYGDMLRDYYGAADGTCTVDPAYAVEWAYIPHFYYNYYVWQYATSIAASSLHSFWRSWRSTPWVPAARSTLATAASWSPRTRSVRCSRSASRVSARC